jgi:hypothetical protein
MFDYLFKAMDSKCKVCKQDLKVCKCDTKKKEDLSLTHVAKIGNGNNQYQRNAASGGAVHAHVSDKRHAALTAAGYTFMPKSDSRADGMNDRIIGGPHTFKHKGAVGVYQHNKTEAILTHNEASKFQKEDTVGPTPVASPEAVGSEPPSKYAQRVEPSKPSFGSLQQSRLTQRF